MGGQTDGLIFNPMKDLDSKDTYTRNFEIQQKKIIYRPDTMGVQLG